MIKKIIKQKDLIKIIWNDDQVSKFHFLWLRDNCPSNEHPDARQKIFNIISVSEKIYPIKFFINTNNNLEIHWSENKHISYFKTSWLKNNCYTLKNKKSYKKPYQIWNSNFTKNLSKIKIDHDDIINNDVALKKWLKLLIRYGVSIIKNAPLKKQSAFKIYIGSVILGKLSLKHLLK